MQVLPHSAGRFALPRFRSRQRRFSRFTGAVGLVTALSLILTISPAGAGSSSGWTSTNWTGVRAGAPEPGTNLPTATAPAVPVPLPPELDVHPEYEGQSQCDPTPKPGTQRLADLIKATYGADQTVWIPRGCDVGGQSEHKEGRAIDWMVDIRDAQDRANADALADAVRQWLDQPARCTEVVERFTQLHEQLRCNAAARIAEMIHDDYRRG